MLVTHILPQKIESLSQGQIDIAFGMPLKREVQRKFKLYDSAFDSHPLDSLITFFSKAPLYEEQKGELLDYLPFPALYGTIGDEGFAISTQLLNHILIEALDLEKLEQTTHQFSAFELKIITKALNEKCGSLSLSEEAAILEPLLNEEGVKVTSFYANKRDVTLQLFSKTTLAPKLKKVILATKMVTPERLRDLRCGDALIFENINPKEVRCEGENTPFALTQKGNKFIITKQGEA